MLYASFKIWMTSVVVVSLFGQSPEEFVGGLVPNTERSAEAKTKSRLKVNKARGSTRRPALADISDKVGILSRDLSS